MNLQEKICVRGFFYCTTLVLLFILVAPYVESKREISETLLAYLVDSGEIDTEMDWEQGKDLYVSTAESSKKKSKTKTSSQSQTVLPATTSVAEVLISSAAPQVQEAVSSREIALAATPFAESISLANIDDIVLSVAQQVQSEESLRTDQPEVPTENLEDLAEVEAFVEDFEEEETDGQVPVETPYNVFLQEEEEASPQLATDSVIPTDDQTESLISEDAAEIEIKRVADEILERVTNEFFEEFANIVLNEDSADQSATDYSQALIVYQPNIFLKGKSAISAEAGAGVSFKNTNLHRFFSVQLASADQQQLSIVQSSTEDVTPRGSEKLKQLMTTEETIPHEDFDSSQLEIIMRSIDLIKESIQQLKNEQFISNNSANAVRKSLEDGMTSMSKNVSLLISDLDKKISKTSISLVTTQEAITSEIKSVKTSVSKRLDSMESEL